jgi:hypothetical protein
MLSLVASKTAQSTCDTSARCLRNDRPRGVPRGAANARDRSAPNDCHARFPQQLNQLVPCLYHLDAMSQALYLNKCLRNAVNSLAVRSCL